MIVIMFKWSLFSMLLDHTMNSTMHCFNNTNSSLNMEQLSLLLKKRKATLWKRCFAVWRCCSVSWVKTESSALLWMTCSFLRKWTSHTSIRYYAATPVWWVCI